MIKLIAVGASTGGTDAIIETIKTLPEDSPPVVIVQHLPGGFTSIYAERLAKLCRMRVKEADNGDRLSKGVIYTARADRQLTVYSGARGLYIKLGGGAKVCGHCPSVDVLFDSAAECCAGKAVGVLLTGMGRDGAEGLLKMKQSGCVTMTQDKASCVVYGMPRVAFELGAADIQGSPRELGERLNEIIKVK